MRNGDGRKVINFFKIPETLIIEDVTQTWLKQSKEDDMSPEGHRKLD